MAEKIEFDASGFSGLKAQIREANLEYQALLANVDATPEAIQAAAAKVAGLKDQVNDANDAIQAMTQQGRFQAFTKGLAAVSGGFTAVQGAIGLVSNDTKAFEKTFQKLQSAMALTQGLTALADLGDAFGAMKVAAVSAFNGIKAAIGSTGIGLLIVGLGIAIGALINYFNEASEAEEENKRVIDQLNASLETSIALSDDLSRRRANQVKIDEANAKLAGKSIKEISDIRQKAYIKDRDAAIQNVRDINAAQDRELLNFKGTEEEKKKITDKYAALRNAAITKRNNAETALTLEQIDRDQQIQNKAEANKKKNQDTAEQREKKAQERRVKNLEAQRDLDLAQIEREKLVQLSFATTEEEKVRIEDDATKKRLTIQSKFEEDREALRAKEDQNATALEAKLTDLGNQRKESSLKTQETLTKIAKDAEEKRIKDAEEAAQKALELEEKKRKNSQRIIDEHFLYLELDAKNEIKNKEQLNAELERLELEREKKRLLTLEEGSVEYLELANQIKDKELAIEEEKTQKKLDNLQKQIGATLDAANQVFNAMQAFSDRDKNREMEALKEKGLSEEEAAKQTDEINRKYFEKNKSVQIGQAIINTLQSSISAFASLAAVPVVGPALGAIAAAAALAAGYATVQKIQETTYTSSIKSSSGSTPQGSMYAEGGILQGKSHNMGGIRTSMGELEGGEFVVNRRATANFLPLLDAINSAGNNKGPELPETQQTPVFKTYVVASEMTSQQEANAKLSALARI